MARGRGEGSARVGAVLWIVQLLAFLIEAITIAMVDAPYSLIDNTLSDLGATGCGTVAYPGTDVYVCSPAHLLFNGSLLVGAVAVGIGAVLLLPSLARPRAPRLATVGVTLIVIAQVSGMATALIPIDVDTELHTLVSAPGFVAQPAGLLLIGLAGLFNRRWWGLPLALTGGFTFLIGGFFILRLDPIGGGLLERLVLWPAFIAFALVAVEIIRRPRAAPMESMDHD